MGAQIEITIAADVTPVHLVLGEARGRRSAAASRCSSELTANFRLGCCALAAAMAALIPCSAMAQQIWFSPGDDLDVGGTVTHPDFARLFVDPSPWPTGLGKVNVFQFRSPYITRKPDDSRKYFDYLKGHNIGFAVTMTVMPSDTCGQGVEGIMSHKGIDMYPRTIKAAGVSLDYVVMDEPLFFGHDYTGKNACNLSIDDVAKGVAESITTIKSYHPNAKFVLVEPEQSLPGGVAELAQFLDAYKKYVHEYPSSVRFDVGWRRNWRSELPPFISMLSSHNIGYGVVYNATGGMSDDAAWVASAKENATGFASAIHAKPEHIMIQTWDPKPSHIVPEADPNSMSGYLKWFLQQGRR